VIVVTDGDKVAKKSVQTASKNLGLRCISLSAGNPTPLTPEETVELIMQAKAEPVVVMVDDKGNPAEGAGERVLKHLAKDSRVNLLGVVAVASNTACAAGVKPDCSITKSGQIYPGSVDKHGFPESIFHEHLEGDTVEVLNELNVPVIIGIGDIGKMDGLDDHLKGAPTTTKALKQVLERSGQLHGDGRKD
jgi:stage V sporulation protein AE